MGHMRTYILFANHFSCEVRRLPSLSYSWLLSHSLTLPLAHWQITNACRLPWKSRFMFGPYMLTSSNFECVSVLGVCTSQHISVSVSICGMIALHTGSACTAQRAGKQERSTSRKFVRALWVKCSISINVHVTITDLFERALREAVLVIDYTWNVCVCVCLLCWWFAAENENNAICIHRTYIMTNCVSRGLLGNWCVPHGRLRLRNRAINNNIHTCASVVVVDLHARAETTLTQAACLPCCIVLAQPKMHVRNGKVHHSPSAFTRDHNLRYVPTLL